MNNRRKKSVQGRFKNAMNLRRNSSRAARTLWRACSLAALFALLTVAASSLTAGVRQASATASAPQNVAPVVASAEDYQSLLDLQSPWTVMCVAAHPDDEDGSTLTVLRRKYGAHTVTVFSTYGEGGQNAVGPELYEELGAIRARETMAAALIQGSEAYFLGLRDFGFSKSAAEAFRFWGHEEALARMVLKIRQLRPDVIITNHDTTSGHGHHQATGQLVLEAFDAAADSRRFPGQLKNGVTVWQPQRLFVRFQFEGSGSKAAEAEAERMARVVTVDRSERDPARGTTYAEQALAALQQHASQGPWPRTVPPGWTTPIRYRLARSAKSAPPLPENPQTFLDGMSLPGNLAERLTPLATKALLPLYEAPAHQGIISSLVSIRKSGYLSATSVDKREGARFRLMDERLTRALAVASRIKATLAAQNDVLIRGTATPVTLKISNDGESAAQIQGITLRGLRSPVRLRFPQTLAPGQAITFELTHSTPRSSPLSVPHSAHLYDGRIFGEELAASVRVEIDGAAFPVEATERIDIAPAVEITSITPSPLVLTPATKGQTRAFTLELVNHQQVPATARILPNASFVSLGTGDGIPFTLGAKETRSVRVEFPLDWDAIKTASGRGSSSPVSVGFTLLQSKPKGFFVRRDVPVIFSDARVAQGLRVGYVRSYDDTLRDSLAALGVEARELTIDDVRSGDLKDFQAVIIDNRGYQAHPELIQMNSRLLDYARGGGTLIVFYHKTNEWNPDERVSRPQLAPYPITLGNARVTDETARIEFSDPQHALLNYPNKITQGDFAAWIQERGLYYPQTWDAHYTSPLSMSDEGEKSLAGGLLAADYGRGHYIYTSMVWYRQLRAGIPGAYRMLANMISYGRR